MLRSISLLSTFLPQVNKIIQKNPCELIRVMASTEMETSSTDAVTAEPPTIKTEPTVTEIKEGKANLLFPKSVFYNPVQEFNRDVTVAVISEFAKEFLEKKLDDVGVYKDDEPMAVGVRYEDGIRVLEGLGATGLRAVRFGLEVPGIKEVVCNDYDETAVENIKQNITRNTIGNLVSASCADAALLMYQCRTNEEKFDVIDIDPYGSPSVFLDAAVQAIRDGGLLCVTATDMAVMSGNFGETAYTKYGSYSIRSKACHEMALRMLLHAIDSHANKYSKYIVPVLSLSVDFYIRVFVRVHAGQGMAKLSASKQGYIYQCNGCDAMAVQPLGYSVKMENDQYKHSVGVGPPVGVRCEHCGEKHKIAGPVWISRLHDREFVTKVQERVHKEKRLATHRRLVGMLSLINEELPDVVLYYIVDELCKILHCTCMSIAMFRSAILTAGYEVSSSHAARNSIKTSAPIGVIWDILRLWVKHNPVNEKRLQVHSAAKAILEVESKLNVTLELRTDANAESKKQGLLRYQINPQKDWGPKSRAKKDPEIGDLLSTSPDIKKAKKRKRRKPNDTKKVPCKEVKRGDPCELGDECPFSHDPEVIKNYQPFTKRFPCKRFKKGSCDLGDECRYSHTLVAKEDNEGNEVNEGNEGNTSASATETNGKFTEDSMAVSMDFQPDGIRTKAEYAIRSLCDPLHQ